MAIDGLIGKATCTPEARDLGGQLRTLPTKVTFKNKQTKKQKIKLRSFQRPFKGRKFDIKERGYLRKI